MPTDSEGNINPGGNYSGPPMNRKQRRKAEHRKNRQFTKKGFTRVIKREDNGQMWNIPTRQGSRMHNIAKHSVKKMHRDQSRGQ